jgi:hypothetical protein
MQAKRISIEGACALGRAVSGQGMATLLRVPDDVVALDGDETFATRLPVKLRSFRESGRETPARS